MNSILDEALRLHDAGWCVLPTKIDGSKSPALDRWKPFKTARPSQMQLEEWCGGTVGLSVIGGRVSGNAELLDFDDHENNGGVFRQWIEAVPLDLSRKLVIYRTPKNGWRACYRCTECIPGTKQILAKRSKKETLIELLAAQIALVPGGDIRAHEDRKPYIYVRGHLTGVRTITPEERDIFLSVARQFNQHFETPKPKRFRCPKGREQESKPDWFASDDFNLRGKWPGILEPHGWTCIGDCEDDGVLHWQRPGKSFGVSATTNYAGQNLLHVFTSSTKFNPHTSYSKFAAYAVLTHDGDFSTAAKTLALHGYGRANQEVNYSKITMFYERLRK